MGNLDIKNLMKILSNMDKKDLEKGINQAKQRYWLSLFQRRRAKK